MMLAQKYGCVLAVIAVLLPGGAAQAQRKAIPWVELNYPSVEKYRTPVLFGTQIAAITFDEVIISTIPQQLPDLYRSLGRQFPTVRIIPGVKTAPYVKVFGRFDSPGMWRRIALDIRRTCEAAGSKRFLIENEGSYEPIWKGDCVLDHQQLAEGLRQLPGDIEIIWYPAIVGNPRTQPQKYERTYAICRTVAAAVSNVKFVDISFQYQMVPPLPTDPPERKKMRAQLRELGGTIPILYFYGRLTTEAKDWAPEQVPDLLAGAGELSEEFIVYPGAMLYPQVMAEIGIALRERKRAELEKAGPDNSDAQAALRNTEQELSQLRELHDRAKKKPWAR